MERRKKIIVTIPEVPKRWGLKEVLADLKERGAIEISSEMRKKEPYKSYMKDIRKNGKFVCEK